MAIDTAQAIATSPERYTECGREEAAAIAGAVNGNYAAIDWLITRYRGRAVRLATHILRRSGEAEDAAQEAFIRAFRNIHDFRRDGEFYTWLYRIVVRVCLDRLREARWKREVELDVVSSSCSQSPGGYADVELQIVIEHLLDQLKPQMRAIIVLRELEGLEYSEIAQVLQIPVGRVKWRLNAARSKFQALWLSAQQETDNVQSS